MHNQLLVVRLSLAALTISLFLSTSPPAASTTPTNSTSAEWQSLDALVADLLTNAPKREGSPSDSQLILSLKSLQKQFERERGESHFLTRSARIAVDLAVARQRISGGDEVRDSKLRKLKAESILNLASGRTRQAVEALNDAASVADSLGPEWKLEHAHCTALLALALRENYELDKSITACEKAMAEYEQLSGSDHPWHLAMRVQRAFEKLNIADDSAIAELAAPFARKLIDVAGTDWASRHVGPATARVLLKAGQKAEAKSFCRQWYKNIAAIDSATLNEVWPRYFLGDVLHSCAESAEALKVLLEAEQRAAALAKRHPCVLHSDVLFECSSFAATIEDALGKEAEAFKRAVAALATLRHSIHTAISGMQHYRIRGQGREILQELEIARTVAEYRLDRKIDVCREVNSMLIQVLSETGDFKRAYALATTQLKLCMTAFGEKSIEHALAIRDQGFVLGSHGHYERALAQYDNALKLLAEHGLETSGEYSAILVDAAVIACCSGDKKSGLKYAREATKHAAAIERRLPILACRIRSRCGAVLSFLSQDDGAKREAERSVEILGKMKPADIEDVFEYLYSTRARSAPSLEVIQIEFLLSIQQQVLEHSNPQLLRTRRALDDAKQRRAQADK